MTSSERGPSRVGGVSEAPRVSVGELLAMEVFVRAVSLPPVVPGGGAEADEAEADGPAPGRQAA